MFFLMTHVSLFLEVVIRIWTEFTLDSCLTTPRIFFSHSKIVVVRTIIVDVE